MLREIVLDTETTGTDALAGDRLVEIGCIELMDRINTGRTFHTYINPERTVSQGAFAVHGLSDAFLSDKPAFSEIAEQLFRFCDDSRLVIHNAAFDVGFINAEIRRLATNKFPLVNVENVTDTLMLARQRHPGAANSLDALCSRYGINNSGRTKHGALLDAQLLSEVYIELLGGKQGSLGLMQDINDFSKSHRGVETRIVTSAVPRGTRTIRTEELERQLRYVREDLTGAIWNEYLY